MKKIIIISILIASLLYAKDDIDSLTIQLNRIGEDVEYITKDDISDQVLEAEYRLNQKLQDGYILFLLDNYSKAAIVFYDIISRKELKNELAYVEAMFYLAESLKKMDNDLGAREYYRQVLEHPSKKFDAKALQELLDIAYRLEDHKAIEKFTAKAEKSTNVGANIYYRKGKVYFQQKRYKKAIKEFSKIKKDDSYYIKAVYFMGICNVAYAKDIEDKYENARDLFLQQKRVHLAKRGSLEMIKAKKENTEALYKEKQKEFKTLKKSYVTFNKWVYSYKKPGKKLLKKKEAWDEKYNLAKEELEKIEVSLKEETEEYNKLFELEKELRNSLENNKNLKKILEKPYKERHKIYEKGVEYFKQVKSMRAKDEDEQLIIDEATLAIGRLFYTLQNTDKAIDAYQDVRRASKKYGLSLYESAWSFVQGEKYEKALYAIDLLVDVLPYSDVIPEALLLKGHLYNRMDQSDKALLAYDDVKDKYSALSEKLDRIMKNNEDLEEYFRSLMGLDLDNFKLSKVLPKEAVNFVNAEKDVKKARKIVKSLEEAKNNLDESYKLLRALLKALDNKTAVASLFPKTDEIRFKAKGLLNKLLSIEYKLNNILDKNYTSKNDTYNQRHARIESLWNIFKKAPDSEKEYSSRKKAMTKEFIRLEQKAYQLKIYLSQMKDEINAMEKLFNENNKKYNYSEEKKFFFTKQIMNKKRTVKNIEDLLDRTSENISSDKNSLGSLDDTTLNDDKIREELHTLLKEERAEYESARVNKYQEVIVRNDKIEEYRKKINHFTSSLEKNLEQKAELLKKDVKVEEVNLAQYKKELDDKLVRSKELSSKIALKSFKYVNKKFYELILNAEIGSLEVAWKDKDKLSKKIQDYYSQERNRKTILENEFKEILGDSE